MLILLSFPKQQWLREHASKLRLYVWHVVSRGGGGWLRPSTRQSVFLFFNDKKTQRPCLDSNKAPTECKFTTLPLHQPVGQFSYRTYINSHFKPGFGNTKSLRMSTTKTVELGGPHSDVTRSRGEPATAGGSPRPQKSITPPHRLLRALILHRV